MKKLLVIRFGAMGDLLHVSPSFGALKAQSSSEGVEIHFLTSPMYKSLAEHMPGIDHIHTWDKRWASFSRLLDTLKPLRFNALINLHPSFKTWVLTQALGCPQHAVYNKQKHFPPGNAQRVLDRRHAVRDFYEPFRQLFSLPDNPVLAPALTLQKSNTNNTPLIGIIPGVGSKRGNRAWLESHYDTLIKTLLAETPANFILIGGPDEAPLAKRLAQLAPQRIKNTAGDLTIPQTAEALSRCTVVVGADTGPIHLAAATNVPIVAIYGPTSLKRSGPVGPSRITALTPPETLDCWPCEKPVCPLSGNAHMACMQQIPPQTVAGAVKQYL